MIRRIRAFGAFWYDFIIGDDWRRRAGRDARVGDHIRREPQYGRASVVDHRRGRRNSVAPQRLSGDMPPTLSRLATFILLGIHAGRVTLQSLFARVKRLHGGRTLGCAEHVAGRNLGVPVLELHQLDFVLLELAVREVVCAYSLSSPA